MSSTFDPHSILLIFSFAIQEVGEPENYFYLHYLPSRTPNFAKDNDSEEFHASEDHAPRFRSSRSSKIYREDHPEFESARESAFQARIRFNSTVRPLVCRFPLAPLPGFMGIYTNLCASRGHDVSLWPAGRARALVPTRGTKRTNVPAGSTGDPSS